MIPTTDPETMTAGQRTDEIVRILAYGVLRCIRGKKQSQNTPEINLMSHPERGSVCLEDPEVRVSDNLL